MTISATTYWIIFWTVIVLIAASFHFAGKRRGKKSLQSMAVLLPIILIVVNK